MTFELAEPFFSYIAPTYLFSASVSNSRSSFHIYALSIAAVADRAEQPGEVLSELQLGTVHAVMVTNVNMGLPTDMAANQLLVSNGSMSFSAIMLATTERLPDLWDVFVRSVELTPER